MRIGLVAQQWLINFFFLYGQTVILRLNCSVVGYFKSVILQASAIWREEKYYTLDWKWT